MVRSNSKCKLLAKQAESIEERFKTYKLRYLWSYPKFIQNHKKNLRPGAFDMLIGKKIVDNGSSQL